ncbi:MAG: AmmeMemoRadiSam system protein B, partial [Armatimonadetes bacterium]|nr:AmmeMemoRadiSam system protein B [Armatimonadota bacterium]
YGFAYEQLRHSTADLFVVLGIAHSSSCWPEPPPLVSLTRLDFDTPLGRCETDQEFVNRLVEGYATAGGDPTALFRDELVHAQEHSLEFQMLFLQHLHGHRPFRVVPVLMGSLHEFYPFPVMLGSRVGLGPFVTALSEAIGQYPGEVCVVAGADLSHVGPRFGDPQPVGPERVREVEEGDRTALAELAESAAGWFRHFAADRNARNVCSVSNLYLLRALAPESELMLLRHEVAFDPDQTVSFAAAALR